MTITGHFRLCLTALMAFIAISRPAFSQTWGVDFYVSSGGSDALDCATPGEACASIHAAAAKAAASGPQVGGIQRIHVAAGGYNDAVTFTANTNRVDVIGAGAASTVWNNVPGQCGTVIANTGANISVSNIEIVAEGDPCGSALYAQLGGVINVFGGVFLGPTYQAQIYCEGAGSQVEVWNVIQTVGGGANNFIAATSGCLVEFNPVAGVGVTFNANPTYSGGVVFTMVDGIVYIGHTVRWLGAVNGPSYVASKGGKIETDGNGCASLPGSSPGVENDDGKCW